MRRVRPSWLQVLPPLSRGDLAWVCCLPAIAEEFLFRGGLIPATLPDWYASWPTGFGRLHPKLVPANTRHCCMASAGAGITGCSKPVYIESLCLRQAGQSLHMDAKFAA